MVFRALREERQALLVGRWPCSQVPLGSLPPLSQLAPSVQTLGA